jgi:hypothetical protein
MPMYKLKPNLFANYLILSSLCVCEYFGTTVFRRMTKIQQLNIVRLIMQLIINYLEMTSLDT